MSTHTILIKDDFGKSFKVAVSLGWVGFSIGTWRSLDNGSISVPFGTVKTGASQGTLTSQHIYLSRNTQDTYWGIRLNDFRDVLGINDQGMGEIADSWAISLRPNRISWMIVD